ncbi:MAG: prevent-host-death protein [Tannerellaceae bacterium]|nr:prevent-host-death protein [Tannerellaceae bacterium]
MLVISSREFRDRQKSYLDKVDEGMEILIQRSRNKSYKIVPVTEDDTLMSKEDFFAKIDRAIHEKGGTIINNKEALQAYFDNL